MSFRVKIYPQDLVLSAPKGQILSEVVKGAGIPLETACGGQGTCARCVVRVLEGSYQTTPPTASATQIPKDHVLACKTLITDHLAIQIPGIPHLYDIDFSAPFRADVSTPEIIDCPFVKTLQLMPSDDTAPDREGLTSLIPKDYANVEWGIEALRNLPNVSQNKIGSPTAILLKRTDGWIVSDFYPHSNTEPMYGIVCDIGTTTVALGLVNLETGEIIDTATSFNEQIECGQDIISRIIYSQKKNHLVELQKRILDTLNRLLDALFSRHAVDSKLVKCAVFSGNCTMTHLALGVDPGPIRIAPYEPPLKTVPLLSAQELNLHIRPQAVVYFTPGVGSYIGGDITSGVMAASYLRKCAGVNIFIDIGTNGELVVFDDDWMIGCACSAGPAFEGVGIKWGMRAIPGAIESVSIGIKDRKLTHKTIAGVKPEGLCGSGLIDLLASLFRTGLVGRDGKFNEDIGDPRVRRRDNQPEYVLVDARQSKHRADITITERDIANIIRAKAAIFSACSLLFRHLGLDYKSVNKIYIAGGFGCHLNISNAITIGLFPEIQHDRFEYLGNTSLFGAYLVLLAQKHLRGVQKIAKNMTYVDLSSETNYMDEYTAALFLPHTDETLFPSVGKSGQ